MTTDPGILNAGAVVLPFGAYEGETIAKVSETAKGLRNLEALQRRGKVYGRVKIALEVWLEQPDMQERLAAAAEIGRHGQD